MKDTRKKKLGREAMRKKREEKKGKMEKMEQRKRGKGWKRR